MSTGKILIAVNVVTAEEQSDQTLLWKEHVRVGVFRKISPVPVAMHVFCGILVVYAEILTAGLPDDYWPLVCSHFAFHVNIVEN